MQSCENSIAALRRARDCFSGQLDSGALAELDEAIKNLEMALDRRHNAEEVERLKLRTLQALAALVSIATNVRDWLG
ncbi:MAG: hypothetical protein JWQ76_2530 [Ramlibacter sp.]|nr:hypothetical protein [Ramlibacter sp.]